MASTFSPRHVASSQLLGRIAPKVLYRLLKKYEDFFTSQGAMPSDPDGIDCDRISIVFAAPTEQMPAKLMADIVYWDEVAEMGQVEDLIDLAEKHDISLADDVTIEEAALLVRLNAPDALEDLHSTYRAQDLLRKKKRFVSHSATVDPLPIWKRPSQKALDAFAAAMEGWYSTRKKGLGSHISVIEKKDATWFIVRHGGTFKRENAVENGQPKVVFYRPAAFDLLIYYHQHGELAIHNDGNSVKERQAYCTFMGKHIFGNLAFFEQSDHPKYTLEPLRARGRDALDCSEVDGLDSARLSYLRYRFGGGNNHRITHNANDVFEGLEDLGEQIPEGAELLCMGLKLVPTDGLGGERNLRLYYPNVSVFDHEADAELAHRFLDKNKFLLSRNGSTQSS